MLSLYLPYPPSANAMYERRLGFTKKGKPYRATRLTQEVEDFRKEVAAAIWAIPPEKREVSGPLAFYVWAHPPDDNRKRDLDNIVKALSDAVCPVLGVDDTTIDQWYVKRHWVGKPGVEVLIVELDGA